MVAMWSEKLWDLVKSSLVLFLLILGIQGLVSAFLTWAVSSVSNIEKVSLRILGKSISAFCLRTPVFDLKIGNIQFSLGRKLGIVLKDVRLELLENKHKDKKKKKNAENALGHGSATSSLFNDEELRIPIGARLLLLLKCVLPVRVYTRNLTVLKPDGNQIQVGLGTLGLSKISEEGLSGEVFLHAVAHRESGIKVHHISYEFSTKAHESKDSKTRKNVIVMNDWKTFLRISGVYVKAPKLPELNIVTDSNAGQDPSNDWLNRTLAKLELLIKEFRAPVRAAKVIDAKVENINLVYEGLATLTISSVQLLLEAVNFYSYGVNLEFLPSKEYAHRDHQLSVTVNSIILEVNGVPIVKVPLLNSIITSDLASTLFRGIPLSKAKVLSTLNVINPTIILTVDQILTALSFINSHKAKEVGKNNSGRNGGTDSKDNHELELTGAGADEVQDFDGQKEKTIQMLKEKLEIIPNIVLEVGISNFSITLQLSERDNLVFKMYNVQSLAYHQNEKMTFIPDSTVNSTFARPELAYLERDPFMESMTNYLKIVGATLTFFRAPNEHDGIKALSVPICGFERHDSFMDDITDFKFNVHSTLRHFSFTLDDFDVFNRINEALVKILLAKKEGDKTHLSKPSKAQRSFTNPFVMFDWSLKMRFKDASCSMLLARFLPRHLDPVELRGVNLSDVSRGCIFVISETFLELGPQVKNCHILDSSLIRIIEDPLGKQLTDTVLKFKDLKVTVVSGGGISVTLPCLHVKFDVNIVWFAFYVRSIFEHYFSRFKQHQKLPHHEFELKELENVDLTVGKINIDITLPEDTPVLLTLENVGFIGKKNLIKVANFSALVRSVYVNNFDVFIPLAHIQDLEIDLRLINEGVIGVVTSEVHLNTEYHFKFYVITDNVVTFYKAIKQMDFAFKDLNEFHKLYPSQMLARKIPTLRFSTKLFCAEVIEDPFEQELGLIFKIGVLEQRERLEKLKEFEVLKDDYLQPSIVSDMEPTKADEEYENTWVWAARERLLENFSTSWISRYREAKVNFYGMPPRIIKHQDLCGTYYLFSEIVGSKVTSLKTCNVEMTLEPPSFPLDKLADFVYTYGKKVPKDTAYTLLLACHFAAKTDLWELRVRDYPLAAVSFPSISTKGDVVLGERMPEESSLRTVYVPFVPGADTVEHRMADSIYGSHIIRTLNAFKLYLNVTSHVHSTIPATVTWGKSLQPGYESLMLWFDYLTRPKDDPSPKLGFWDKGRFFFHGRWICHFSDISGIQLNVKGSENPYKIADDGAGLTSYWTGGTIIRLHDSADPRDFLVIQSKRLTLAVRDFTEPNKFDKVCMNLDGNVLVKVGMLFEQGDSQEPGGTPRSIPSKPHYDITMKNAAHIQDPETYDAYSGFRSSFIHMSLGVYSTSKDSVNCLYLAPHSFAHSLKWWNLFHTYTSGPIRQGPLFNTLEPNKAKFGRSLFTIKYQICLTPLVFTHAYRHYSDFGEDENVYFTGLKGKLKSVKIDLHQERVKLLHTNEKLKKSKKIWTFKIPKGEFDCSGADIRILTASFKQCDLEEDDISSQGQGDSSSDSFEYKDSPWFDLEDYVDLDQVSLDSAKPISVEAMPLMYSPRISYFRKMNDTGYVVKYPFGDEDSHRCMMGKNHSENTQRDLALERGKEIEEEIKTLTSVLEKIKQKDSKSKTYNTQCDYISQKLNEAKHRSFIIESILDDLKHSAEVPDAFNRDEEGQTSIMSHQYSTVDEENAYWADPGLQRLQTIETFRKMRRESSIQTDSRYDNRFFVHNIQFKVNKRVRDSLLQYLISAFERKSMQFFLTYKSVTLINELVNTAIANSSGPSVSPDDHDSDESLSTEEFMERFTTLIREVPNNLFDYLDSYLIRLISPQLQVTSENEPNTAAIVTSRDIEVGIIDVVQALNESGDRVVMDVNTIVETRVCVIAKDIQVFTLLKNDVLATGGEGLHTNGYGVTDRARLWPPWIPMEVCFEGSLLGDNIFLRRKSMFFMHTVPNPLFFSDKEIPGLSSSPKFRVGFPGLVITSTSQQYCAIYNIVQDLLDFGANLEGKVAKLANVMMAEEVKYNLEKLDTSVVTNLQAKVKEQYYAREFLKLHNPGTFKRSSKVLTLEIRTTLLELYIIMTAIKKNYDNLVKGHKTGTKRLEWRVATDELIWQMYDDKKKPFMTIALDSSKFTRFEALDGTNTNTVAVSSVQVFNQQENPTYAEIVVPFDTNSHYSKDVPMLEISWKLGPPVGGIGDLQSMVVAIQPTRFKIDHITSDRLLNYLFPKNDRQPTSTTHTNPIGRVSISPGSYLPKRWSMNGSPSRQTALSTVLDTHGNRRPHSPVNVPSTEGGAEGDSLELTASRSESDVSSSLGRKASKKIATQLFNQPGENINEMVKRSGTYFNIGSVNIKKSIISVCYKGAHHVLTDVDNLTVHVPNLHYENKLWSRDEFLSAIKKDVTRVVLGHLGNIIGNKLLPHKKESKSRTSVDVSQMLRLDTSDATLKNDSGIRAYLEDSPTCRISEEKIQEEPADEEADVPRFSGEN